MSEYESIIPKNMNDDKELFYPLGEGSVPVFIGAQLDKDTKDQLDRIEAMLIKLTKPMANTDPR